MPHIQSIEAIEILDSRGNPTLSVKVRLKCGITARASVPSGASTGEHEAKELRDGNKDRYQGKGVLQAVRHVEGALQTLLSGENVLNQSRIDALMVEADGTENKERFGANAILGISLACARAAARYLNIELFQYLGGNLTYLLPCPMLNIINGGAHADNSIEFQEFMIRPHAAATFQEALRAGSEVFHTLKKILHKKNLVTSVGDEGGFAPNLDSDEEALSLICEAITASGYTPGKDISLALDCAASSLFDPAENRYIEVKKRQKQSSYEKRDYKEQVHYLQHLAKNYPIDSIEDGLAENDWEGWQYMTEKMGKEVQIVGDDIFVTNPKFLERGIKEGCANAILIKVNQIGTLTETFRTIQDAHKNNYRTIISHRSGETEDSFIADLAVACNAGQIKTGAPCRSDRVAKYNRLLEIERTLRPYAVYMDSNAYSKGLL